LMKLAAKKRLRVFLFGGTKGIAQQCKEVLEERYKGLQIVGTMIGEFQISQPEAGRPLAENLKTGIITRINHINSLDVAWRQCGKGAFGF